MDFIALYSVEGAIVRPVVAKRGEILTVWPAHPTHTVAVCANRPGYPVLRYATVSMGALYGMALMWEMDGIIAPLTPESAVCSWPVPRSA
jgi:hypothetical protein